eukprot:symbB.v1.2.014500.t1/scaffold1061.1/size140413/6
MEGVRVAVVSSEDNEIMHAIALSVDGLLIQEAAVPWLRHCGWQQRDMEEQNDAAFTLWDAPEVAPAFDSLFHLMPNPPGPNDPVWSAVAAGEAALNDSLAAHMAARFVKMVLQEWGSLSF